MAERRARSRYVRRPPLARAATSAPALDREPAATEPAEPRAGGAQRHRDPAHRATRDAAPDGGRGEPAAGGREVARAVAVVRGRGGGRAPRLHALRLARLDAQGAVPVARARGAPRGPRPVRVDGAALSLRRDGALRAVARGAGGLCRRGAVGAVGLADRDARRDHVPPLERRAADRARAPPLPRADDAPPAWHSPFGRRGRDGFELVDDL